MNKLNYDGSKHPYMGSHIEKLGYLLFLQDGQWVTFDNVEELQSVIDSYDPLFDAISEAIAKCDEWHAATLKAAVAPYTAEERETWAIKLEAAKAYLNNSATAYQTAMLEAEAPAYGYTTEQHAQRIIEKSQAYHLLVGQLAGKREQFKNSIRNASSVGEISIILADIV